MVETKNPMGTALQEDNVPLYTCLGGRTMRIPHGTNDELVSLRPGDTEQAAVHVTLRQLTYSESTAESAPA